MSDLSKIRAIAAEFGLVEGGPGDDGGDRLFPSKVAWRIFPVIELRAKLAAAVLHVAQAHAYAARDKQAVEAMGRITEEIIDDLCPPLPSLRLRWWWPWPWPPPPPEPWWSVIEQLGELAAGYPVGSLLRTAAFDLTERVVARARDAKPLARSLETELAAQAGLRDAK